MPSDDRRLNSAIEEYLEYLTEKRRAEVTVKGYRWLIMKTNRVLEEEGIDAHPSSWDKATVNLLRDKWEDTLEPSVMRRQFAVLGKYLEFHNNPIIRKMEMEWPQDTRIHVDWLEPQQAQQLLDCARGDERIILHLELCLGMRRIEVLRLRMQDIGPNYLHVTGKGKQGGKKRTIPFHPDTRKELEYYMSIRENEIRNCRKGVREPDELLIYGTEYKLKPYKRTAVDKRLKRVGQRCNCGFSNHTLRRTFGRNCWLAGVPIETIAQLLGHEDTKTSILYLGLNIDDMQDAMKKLFEFQKTHKRAI